jgi:hypothetical protein
MEGMLDMATSRLSLACSTVEAQGGPAPAPPARIVGFFI